MVKLPTFLASQFSDLRAFKTVCTEILLLCITNNGLTFHHEIFHIYSVLRFTFSYSVELDNLQQRFIRTVDFNHILKCNIN